MDISLANEDLEECATGTANAARRWGPEIVDRYLQRLVLIAAAAEFRVLGIDAEFWMNLESRYQLGKARAKAG